MQNVFALLIVALAVAYLALRGWQFFAARKSQGCGSSCGGCKAGETSNKTSPPLVAITPLKRQLAE